MSQTQVLEQPVAQGKTRTQHVQKRRIANAFWQPFLQFKLLMYMLGTTAVVAVLLGIFLYYAFSDMIGAFTGRAEVTSYYAELIEIQLIHLFRYCGALFVLYILLLATVCVAYTHRLIGPLRPFTRHVEALNQGDYSSRVTLRKNDLQLYAEYADKLNQLATRLERTELAIDDVKTVDSASAPSDSVKRADGKI